MLFRKKHPPVGLMIVLVILLFGASGCFKDAGDDTAPTKVNLRELDPVISTPLASNTPSVPTFTPAPEIGATKTQIIGGPPVNTVESETSGVNGEEVTPPPTFTPPPTVDLADATLPPAGFADTGISPTPSLTLTVTLEPGLPTPTPVAPPDKCIYVIQAGDTLYSVAFELDIFPEDFYPVNPELAANPNSLYIGQEIRIPDCISETATVDPNAPAVPVVPDASPATQAPPPSGSAQTYTVQSGDNLFRISLRFGITVEQLVAANPGTLVNQNTVIQPGMILNIPAASQ
jgi:LysM repeat protein